MPLGLYISIPFCRTKCSYCNFASDVFSKSAYEGYVGRVLEDIAASQTLAASLGCAVETARSTRFISAEGRPASSMLRSCCASSTPCAINLQWLVDAEITVECAPGTLTNSLIETLLRAGANRVSLGVQSFVDQEAQSVGRLHKRATVLEEVARLREAGLHNINIDLIAGLPYQTTESWTISLAEAIALGAPHASVYMLEVDEDSRLGRELIAGGARYHAHFVPDDEAAADFYLQACETLNSAGVTQYEISNFARPRSESLHNLKYWTRQPYFGFGVDAHSMLPASSGGNEAIRFAASDSLDAYMNRAPHTVTAVSTRAAIEESFFLGLRLNRGLDLDALRRDFSADAIAIFEPATDECLEQGLLEKCGATLRLTHRGRLLSNEVFAKFLIAENTEAATLN